MDHHKPTMAELQESRDGEARACTPCSLHVSHDQIRTGMKHDLGGRVRQRVHLDAPVALLAGRIAHVPLTTCWSAQSALLAPFGRLGLGA